MAFRFSVFLFLAVLFVAFAGNCVRADPVRLALVMGNSDYEFGALKNPANDAALMAESLREVGFEVFEHLDADQRDMKRAIVSFGRALGEAGEDAVGLVYYAGHGVQFGGENYMIPVRAQIEDELDVDIEGIRASTLLAALDRAGNRLNIVILDACRNNPFAASSRSAAQGLARMDAPSGTLLAYSTSPGNVAVDGAGRNSPYTQALARAIREPGTKVEDVFKRVRIAVMERTNEKQVPWESSSLTGDFFFTEAAPEEPAASAAIPASTPAPSNQMVEIEYWKSIANSDNPDLFRGYLGQFPEGVFASIARERIASLEQDQAARALTRQRDIEQQLWDEVKDSGDPALLRSFLAQYPEGIYSGLAEARLSSLAAKNDAVTTASQAEIVFWQSIKDSSNAADFNSYLAQYPEGRFAAIAKNRIAALTSGEQVASLPARINTEPSTAQVPRPAGERLWRGVVSTSGGHFAGISWCAGNKKLDIELVESDGAVNGFILAENGQRISVQGRLANNRLEARANVARGFRVVGNQTGDTVKGKIWTPTSSMVCEAKFSLTMAN